MNVDLVSSFPISEKQREMLFRVFSNKAESLAVLTATQAIPGKCRISILSFEDRPEVYLWTSSFYSRKICKDIVLSDEEVEIAVEGLEMKYSHARSRKNPIANSDVVLACVDFVNRRDPKPITYCE